jgi:beta-glucosidase-like glycosyl hydrolase/CubicO group peptidase (beta-lactamase class C family)
MVRLALTLGALFAFWGCYFGQHPSLTSSLKPPAFLDGPVDVVDSLMATLSMEQRVAQLLMVPIYARTDTAGWAEAERWTRDLGLGGVICMQGGPAHQRVRLKRLQDLASVPLMVSSDAEWGLGMRLDSTRSFPRAMTLGATRNKELVRMFGQVVGQSLRATGVHVNFAPVVDVNSNPINPVIGSRSFGESVAWVSRLGQAYADGLQDQRVLATAKHFPGHGDSDSDSHATLPSILHDRARLDSVELAPFKHAFDHGMGGVMVAHLDVPELDSTEAQPSTLSPAIVDTLLRQEMGFQGLVFTDAMSMKGFADFAGERRRIRDALKAGNDVLLFPGDPVAAIEEAMASLADGTLDTLDIDTKCRRVLLAKLWSHAGETVPATGTAWEPKHAELVHRELLAQSLTMLPGHTSYPKTWYATQGHAVMLDLANHGKSCAPLEDQLANHLGEGWTVSRHVLGKDGSGLGKREVQSALAQATHVLVTATEMSHRPSRNFGVQPEGLARVAELLAERNLDPRNVMVVWMGNPYALSEFVVLQPHVAGILVAYQDDERTCHAVADAVAGVTPIGGSLPVTPLATPWREGDGLNLEGAMRLGRPVDGRLAFWDTPNAQVDSLLQLALDRRAMPGARVVVAHAGQIVVDHTVGTLDGTQPTTPDAVYDLASITKVAATGNALMHMSGFGLLEEDGQVHDLLPDLKGHPLGTRSPRQLLSHQAGLASWIPFYRSALEDTTSAFCDAPDTSCHVPVSPGMFMEEAYLDTIWNTILNAELDAPGDYRYSDLGFYMWDKVLSTWGMNIENWVTNHVAAPMGWQSMGYCPLKNGVPLERIAPSEWDREFRECEVRGTVHDPGAAMMGGVACHAGLFSNAYDLAELAETWRRGGVFKGIRIVPEDVLGQWTNRAFPDGNNRRGIAFDKPALEPDSGPTCDLASWESFGHSGFTGTLVWVDPTYDLVYVFLSNRTYPDASNKSLLRLDTRTEIQRVVLEHLGATSRF